jgi:hypothetical protein
MLSNYELYIVLLIINFYEYSFGIVSGVLINFFYKTFFKFRKKESLLVSVPLLFILIIPLLTTLLFFRKKLPSFIPYLKDLDLENQKNFSHPPPLAFAFGFWQTQNQLKKRNDRLVNRLKNTLHK